MIYQVQLLTIIQILVQKDDHDVLLTIGPRATQLHFNSPSEHLLGYVYYNLYSDVVHRQNLNDALLIFKQCVTFYAYN